MRVLFVVPYAPTPVRTRPYHLIKTLAAAGHHVTLATLWDGERDEASVRASLPELVEIVGARVAPWRMAWNGLGALAAGDPVQAHVSWHDGLAARLAERATQNGFDVVHVEHLRGVRYALSIAAAVSAQGGATPPVVWDSVDCISDLCRQAVARGPHRLVRWIASLELSRTERYEGTVVRRFPRVLVTAERDRQGLLRLVSGAEAATMATRLVVLPQGVDLERFAPGQAPREAATLVMTGKMSYHANEAAALRFADEVFPRIRDRRPDAQFLVVGKDPSRELRRLETRAGIRVTGTVDDVCPFLQRASLAVAPLDYGVGIQNKVLEAMACGTPVVATTEAVLGLGARTPDGVVVADGPDAFADAVLKLLDCPASRARLGAEGRRYVETRHAWPTIGRRLEEVYRDAAA